MMRSSNHDEEVAQHCVERTKRIVPLSVKIMNIVAHNTTQNRRLSLTSPDKLH